MALVSQPKTELYLGRNLGMNISYAGSQSVKYDIIKSAFHDRVHFAWLDVPLIQHL